MMRILTDELAASQAELNRKPITTVIARDVMLRLDTDWETGAYATGFPDLLDGDNIPQHPHDVANGADVVSGASKQLMRAWCVGTDTVRVHYAADISDSSMWQAGQTATHTTDGAHRVSVYDNKCFYGYNGDIKLAYGFSASSETYSSSAYTVDTDHIALAYCRGGSLYMAVLHEEGTYKYISLHRVGFDDCPHTIIVDEDYTASSLQWFDACRLGNQDIIFINERTYGHPVVIRWKDGVWSTPSRPVRMDELDNNSFLRIGNVVSVEDSGGDLVLWATGRLSRPGSTGNHPQAFDLSIKSKDGEHWTFDRYCYLCESNLCGKLLVYEDYVYYERGATAMRALRPWTMGADLDSLKVDMSDDILSWTANYSRAGTAVSARTTLADSNGTYNQSTEDSDYPGRWSTIGDSLAIFPGMWIWRYAGYGSETELLCVEGIDRTPESYAVGQRTFGVDGRGLTMRMLYDWASDQHWQFLSQVKHYDDCDAITELYSVSAGQIEVQDDEDDEILGSVDQEEISETEDDEDDDVLIFDMLNKPAIALCTQPVDTRNFRVKSRFSITDDNPNSDQIRKDGHGYSEATFSKDGIIGNVAYAGADGSRYFSDDGQDFNDWSVASDAASLYIIVVENTDGTIAWGWLGDIHADTDTEVYVRTGPLDTDDNGWNGAWSDSKTADYYRISRGDDWARLGTGVGVVGCATDQYNLIAALPDLVGDRLYLVIRRGDSDASAWIHWESVTIDETPEKDYIYEVEMVRRGDVVEVGMFVFTAEGEDRTAITDPISATWPLDEPMVYLEGGEEHNKTDRGKVGILCAISVPETEIGFCRSDKDHLVRNPDLFDTERTVEDHGTYLEDRYTNLDDFRDQMEWITLELDWSIPSVGYDKVPPFHFGGEVYYPTAWNWTFDTDAKFGEGGVDSNGEWDAYDPGTQRWREVRMTHHNYAQEYTGKLESSKYAGGLPYQGRYWSATARGDVHSSVWWKYKLEFGDGTSAAYRRILPAVIRGDDDAVSAQGLTNLMTDITESTARGDRLYAEDMSYTELREREWKRSSGEKVFPTFTVYPGFYLPGRASPDHTTKSHGKGTKLRQHWSPVITLKGVWAYDDESDKTLEWVLKDIAYKAGVMDFDTEYSINEAGVTVPTSVSGAHWLTDVLGEDVYQADFDITVELSSVPSNGCHLSLVARASSQIEGSLAAPPASFSGIAVHVGQRVTYDRPAIELWQKSSNTTDWLLVDLVFVPGDEIGKTVRFVGRKNFVTVYSNGLQFGTMHFGEVYGVDADGYEETMDNAGYIGIYKSGGFSPTATIQQAELRGWTDAITLNTRENAIGGLNRALRDKRVKFVETLSGELPALRISSLSLRYTTANIDTYDHYLGVITDHQSGDDDYPEDGTHVSVYQDSGNVTDRIPTHIRVVGYEIGDYIDHSAAAKYGLLFVSHHCPNLREEEAYQEASRIVRDALSNAASRQPTSAAQLDWEVEDALKLDYTPHDSGPAVSAYYIVDSIRMEYIADPSFEASAVLRKMT